MICPILSIINMKAEVDKEQQDYAECLEERCMWYLRKSGNIEVYDCAIAALAIYSLPTHRQEK